MPRAARGKKRNLTRRKQPATAEPLLLLDPEIVRNQPSPGRMIRIVAPLVVAAATWLTFTPARQAEFVNWDDDKVITENIHIRGFNWRNIQWAFKKDKMGHYHPLTWLSYTIDHAISRARYDSLPPEQQQRYDKSLDPIVFHTFNLLLHAGVAVAFYYLAALLLRMSMPATGVGPAWAIPACAAMAAILFACHPLRVENAVWVTERRDVVSTLFLVPCVIAYLHYAMAPRWSAHKVALYLLSIVLLALSLLGKAWGITLPAVLLLLDYYPLRRIGPTAGWLNRRAVTAWLDKIPFAMLALGFALRAKQAQAHQLDTMKTLAEWGVADRIAQAFYGLYFYAAKTVVPLNLTPLVPLPAEADRNPFATRFVIATVVVLAAAAFVTWRARRWAAGFVAAFAYALTVSPVLGFAQSGPQLVADKYAYIACMPWAILAGAGLLWTLRHPADRIRRLGPIVLGGAVGLGGIYGTLAFRQSRTWHDSYTLWAHAVEVDPRCVIARQNVGMLERKRGNVDEAIAHYTAGLDVEPDNEALLNNLAVLYRQELGDLDKSIELSRRAIELNPKLPELRYALGRALMDAGQVDEAIRHYRKCVATKPNEPKFRRGLGTAFRKAGLPTEARQQYQKILALEKRLDPGGRGVINAYDQLGQIDLGLGNLTESIHWYQQILTIDPDNKGARKGIAAARRRQAAS